MIYQSQNVDSSRAAARPSQALKLLVAADATQVEACLACFSAFAKYVKHERKL